jgi:hypothetical protein
MKKTFLLVFVLSICTITFSQHAKFGIKGGLNAARLEVERADEDAIESRLSFHVGGFAHIHLNRNWAIQPELLYSGQGMIQELGGREFEWKVNYVNVPVMVQYMFNGGFRIQAGPQIGFLTSAEIEDQESEADRDIDDDLKKVDVSLPVGIGYMSPSGFGVDARYVIGLSDINDAGSNDIRNRVFQVGIFYQFRK